MELDEECVAADHRVSRFDLFNEPEESFDPLASEDARIDSEEVEKLLKEPAYPAFSYSKDDLELLQKIIDEYQAEQVYWKKEYAKDGDFAVAIQAYNQRHLEFMSDIRAKGLKAQRIFEVGKALGTDIAGAYRLALVDLSAWTRAIEVAAKFGGDDYAKASVEQNCYVQVSEAVRGALSFGLGMGAFFHPELSLPLLGARLAVNSAYLLYEVYAACCIPIQAAVSGAKGISKQIQWGLSYSPAVKSNRYVADDGTSRLIPDEQELRRQLDEIFRLEDLLKNGSVPQRLKQAARLLERSRGCRALIRDGLQERATRIRAQAESNLQERKLDPLAEEHAFLAEQARFLASPAEHGHDDSSSDADLQSGAQIHRALGQITAEVPALKKLHDLLARIPFGVGALAPAAVAAFDRHFEEIAFCALQIEALLHEGSSLGKGLVDFRADAEHRVAIAMAYTNLHNQHYQGYSRAGRAGLAALAVLFAGVSSVSTISHVRNIAQVVPALNETLGAGGGNQTLLWTLVNQTMSGNSTVAGDLAGAAATTSLVTPLSLGADIAASFIAGLLMPLAFGGSHPAMAARDYEFKIGAQCAVIALTFGRVAGADGKVDPDRLGLLVNGSRKTRLSQLDFVLKFDRRDYLQALLTYVIDPDEVDDVKAPVARYKRSSIGQKPVDADADETWVPRTFACMARIFDRCADAAQRRALFENWAESEPQLSPEHLARARAILQQFEINELAIAAIARGDLAALVVEKLPLLPPRTIGMLIGALCYAGVPLEAPDRASPEYDEWRRVVDSSMYEAWSQADAWLGVAKGNAVKFSNLQSAGEAGAKLGQGFALVFTGSSVPPLLKGAMLVTADVTMLAARLAPEAVIAAAYIKLTGALLAFVGCMFAAGFAFLYFAFIALKNRQLQQMEAQGIREVAHAGVIENRGRDFLTWINTKAYLRLEGWAEVADFTTIAAARISPDHLPPRNMKFKNEVDLAALTWQQMCAPASCEVVGKLFDCCGRPAPSLSEWSFVDTLSVLEKKGEASIKDTVMKMPSSITRNDDRDHGSILIDVQG